MKWQMILNMHNNVSCTLISETLSVGTKISLVEVKNDTTTLKKML